MVPAAVVWVNLSLASTPGRRDQRPLASHPRDTDKVKWKFRNDSRWTMCVSLRVRDCARACVDACVYTLLLIC